MRRQVCIVWGMQISIIIQPRFAGTLVVILAILDPNQNIFSSQTWIFSPCCVAILCGVFATGEYYVYVVSGESLNPLAAPSLVCTVCIIVSRVDISTVSGQISRYSQCCAAPPWRINVIFRNIRRIQSCNKICGKVCAENLQYHWRCAPGGQSNMKSNSQKCQVIFGSGF